MDLHLNTDGARSGEYTLRVASGLAESVRVLNHHTYASAAVPYPSTVYSVLGDVRAALGGLSQLLRQLGDRLAELEETGRVYDDRDRDDAELAARTIAAVREHLRAGQVGEAYREAGHLGLRDAAGGER